VRLQDRLWISGIFNLIGMYFILQRHVQMFQVAKCHVV